MADDQLANTANASAHLGYTLVSILLEELEKEHPGLRKRVWSAAQRELSTYHLLDTVAADWLARKVEEM